MLHHQPSEGVGFGFVAYARRASALHAFEPSFRIVIFALELGRARRSVDAPVAAIATVIGNGRAVLGAIATQKRELNLHASCPGRHGAKLHSSAPSSLKRASSALSIWRRSHRRRRPHRAGFGILLSPTMWSNRVGLTPMYAAAWTRDSPLGARLRGKTLERVASEDIGRAFAGSS
jgi:hypothetical protein